MCGFSPRAPALPLFTNRMARQPVAVGLLLLPLLALALAPTARAMESEGPEKEPLLQNSAPDAEPPSVVVRITKAPLGLRLVAGEVQATPKQETECGRGGVRQGMVLVRIGDWAVPQRRGEDDWDEDGATANEVKSRLAPGRLPVSVEFRPPGSSTADAEHRAAHSPQVTRSIASSGGDGVRQVDQVASLFQDKLVGVEPSSLVVHITKAPLKVTLDPPPVVKETPSGRTELGQSGVQQGMVLSRIGDWIVPPPGPDWDGGESSHALNELKRRLASNQLPVDVEFEIPDKGPAHPRNELILDASRRSETAITTDVDLANFLVAQSKIYPEQIDSISVHADGTSCNLRAYFNDPAVRARAEAALDDGAAHMRAMRSQLESRVEATMEIGGSPRSDPRDLSPRSDGFRTSLPGSPTSGGLRRATSLQSSSRSNSDESNDSQRTSTDGFVPIRPFMVTIRGLSSDADNTGTTQIRRALFSMAYYTGISIASDGLLENGVGGAVGAVLKAGWEASKEQLVRAGFIETYNGFLDNMPFDWSASITNSMIVSGVWGMCAIGYVVLQGAVQAIATPIEASYHYHKDWTYNAGLQETRDFFARLAGIDPAQQLIYAQWLNRLFNSREFAEDNESFRRVLLQKFATWGMLKKCKFDRLDDCVQGSQNPAGGDFIGTSSLTQDTPWQSSTRTRLSAVHGFKVVDMPGPHVAEVQAHLRRFAQQRWEALNEHRAEVDEAARHLTGAEEDAAQMYFGQLDVVITAMKAVQDTSGLVTWERRVYAIPLIETIAYLVHFLNEARSATDPAADNDHQDEMMGMSPMGCTNFVSGRNLLPDIHEVWQANYQDAYEAEMRQNFRPLAGRLHLPESVGTSRVIKRAMKSFAKETVKTLVVGTVGTLLAGVVMGVAIGIGAAAATAGIAAAVAPLSGAFIYGLQSLYKSYRIAKNVARASAYHEKLPLCRSWIQADRQAAEDTFYRVWNYAEPGRDDPQYLPQSLYATRMTVLGFLQGYGELLSQGKFLGSWRKSNTKLVLQGPTDATHMIPMCAAENSWIGRQRFEPRGDGRCDNVDKMAMVRFSESADLVFLVAVEVMSLMLLLLLLLLRFCVDSLTDGP